jgi:hypothetical protein
LEDWGVALATGRRRLRKHDPAAALKHLEVAASLCSADHTKELSEILFLLGIALHRVGMRNCALKSWAAAHRLRKTGPACRFLYRMSNEYGMARQRSSEEDAWQAFYSISLSRYLQSKRSHRLGTDAERDMIHDLIHEAWVDLSRNHDIFSLTTDERVGLFRSVRIVFPRFDVPKEVKADGGREIRVDFARKRRIAPDDVCTCGSGLPYKMCCGRMRGTDELLTGVI